MDFLLSTQYNNVHVTDDRKYLRKLSLTKSFNKLIDNENPVKDSVMEKGIQCAGVSNKNTMISKANQTLKEDNSSNMEKMLMRKNQTSIKQIAKLSLRNTSNKTNIGPANKIQNLQQLESSLLLHPTRNTILYDSGSSTISQLEKSNKEAKHTSSSKHGLPFKNLANKTFEIENLLNSLDDEEDILPRSVEKRNENNCQKIKSSQVEESKESKDKIASNNKTKFFRHKEKNAKVKILKENVKLEILKENSKEPVKKRRFPRRSTNVNQENIYEFLSQSQTTDSDNAKHVDPTAEVVKKLIREGKVQVATNFKGKGKPKFKPRRPPVKKMKKIKTIDDKKLNQFKNKRKKVGFIENHDAVDNDNHFAMDHFQNDHFNEDDDCGLNYPVGENENNLSAVSSENRVNEQDGTFSRLARSVLINQAGRSNTQRKCQRKLLDTVRNIISTPINKRAILPHNAFAKTDLSPIVMAHHKQQPFSPWRVNEEVYIPKTFYFNRSSGNLPSFSSDYIPLTPRKEKSKIHQNGTDPEIITSKKSPAKCIPSPSVIQTSLARNIGNACPQISSLNEVSLISSFSSNDSNAENLPPTKRTPISENENERIFDSKQIPNPRRALSNRSPLKAINILEVIHLPKYSKTTSNSDNIGLNMFGFEENLNESGKEGNNNVSSNTTEQNHASKNTERQTKEDLFGFEDYLSQTEVSCQENYEVSCYNTTANEQNQTMHDKLQSLRKLKPSENELQTNGTQNSKYTNKDIDIFNGPDSKSHDKRQRDIKEMICSTMLDTRPSTSKVALKQLRSNKITHTERSELGEGINLSEFFTDPEPETTFNESEAHRTYIRPQKRKRRLKEDNLIMFLESDGSEAEDDSAEKLQLSRESDDIICEVVSKKKRLRKEPKEDLAMTEFVKEFNELCKEVETYVLAVEESA